MDVSQGPGWWLASDGKWYAPEQHPELLQWLAPSGGSESAPAGAATSAATGQAVPATTAGPATGQTAPAWAATPASSGQAAPPPTAPAAQPPTWGWATDGDVSYQSAQAKRPRRKTIIFAAAGVVVAAAAGIGLYLAFSGSSGPNDTSPQGVAAAAVADFQSGNFGGLCDLIVPAGRATCRFGTLLAGNVNISAINAAVGSVTQNGDEALAVVTGTLCVSESSPLSASTAQSCETNSDPRVDLDKGQTFAIAYAQAQGSNDSFTFPLVEQEGKWYLSTA